MREFRPVNILLLSFFILGMINATMIKPVAENAIYRLAGLGGILAGQTITPKSEGSARDEPQPRAWTVRSGVYTPREVVEGFASLLDTVVHRLGEDAPDKRPARALLLDNVASNLATHTRESTLPFQKDVPDLSRKEMKEQADRIGKTLVKWAREASTGPFDPELDIRSPCENHLLTPVNVDLMFGHRSRPHLMQLFNEYMHQMVLLRDALLPFRNFDEVLIPIDGKAARGIRHLEPSRAQFLTTLVTKSVTQVSVLAYAKALLAPDLPRTDTGGYGFQYEHGTILPAVLSGGDTHFHLLQYIPAKLDPSQKDILFDYEFPDYYTAPRPEISPGSEVPADDLLNFPSESASPVVQNASLGLVPSTYSTPIRQLELRLEFNNGKCIGVDIGQIARGHRYAYQALVGKEADLPAQSAIVHSALDILLHPERGVITAKQGGVHVIPTVEPIIALATLGKLYPENVVLLPENGDLGQTKKAGKGFEPKFIVWGGVKHGGFKGHF
ncbi:hypothetical protein N7447_008553 [Penicillium robsamsonii]|uniref:uncharacterized protein n=1 Tax=Penicillium robsamsonii TaxID=1792511 RepID=UPI002547A59E|nr:uncharacterized protein N7447_008553 [Penicillium robsamsonii]KAJ5816320.1 hypothetical protein N7447_008553 [Penicillium robsamsonii]